MICDDCGRRLDTRTIQTHDCLTDDDVDAPDGADYTDDDLDRFADRAVARYEAMVSGEDGAA